MSEQESQILASGPTELLYIKSKSKDQTLISTMVLIVKLEFLEFSLGFYQETRSPSIS